jgi:hypothetical protein
MNKNKIDIIYILSLGHSGSTILDYSLSYHNESIGLGEVYGVLTDKPDNVEDTKNVITGDSDSIESEIWNNKKEITNISKTKGYKEAYRLLLQKVQKEDKRIIIDSSKKDWLLKLLHDLDKDGEINLHTILLVRDFRGWTNSMKRLEKKMGLMHRPAIYTMCKWYKFNKQFIKFLRKEKIDHIQLGYEYFCQNPLKTLDEIFEKFNLGSFSEKNSDQSNSQIIYGNRLKKTVKSISDVRCDYKWRSNIEVVFSAFILFPILMWNNKIIKHLSFIKLK